MKYLFTVIGALVGLFGGPIGMLIGGGIGYYYDRKKIALPSGSVSYGSDVDKMCRNCLWWNTDALCTKRRPRVEKSPTDSCGHFSSTANK